MTSKTYFVMLRGRKEELLALLLDTVLPAEVEWSGFGDRVIEPTRSTVPRSSQTWDLLAVIRTHKTFDAMKQPPSNASKLLPAFFFLEVEKQEWQTPDTGENTQHVGIGKVISEDWHKLITSENFVRNIIRVTNILAWAIYHIFWTRTIFSPFHMVNLLAFPQGGEGPYDLYRESAGKLIVRGGGGIAYLGLIKGHHSFDELMIVEYKTRFQFLKMALMTPAYWPLILLRDEGLKDSMLHAATPFQTSIL